MNANGASAQRSIAPSLVGDEAPRRVGRFDLVTRLGAGGMANVFLARHQGAAGFERLAAIKLLHRHLSSDEQFVQMFFDEARVAARIHHPNVVPILEIGSEHEQLYMVMDYVEGDTLAAVQRAAIGVKRAIPAGIVLRIILDALSGLDNAHELCGPDGEPLNVVHRDISPQNIIVGIDGVARVVDFGIARAERRLALTSVGTLKGKAPFMAPEQLEGRPVDRRADVFSMGVTLWESFALRRLYPQRNDVETVSKANRVPYRPLRAMLAQLPSEVDEIIERALAFDVDGRFASAAEFAEAIEERLRAHIATHRQVSTFMNVVAGEKVAGEREAVRRSVKAAPSVHAPAKNRYDSGVHQSGRGRTPTGLDVPPPPAMPDLSGLPDLPSAPRGGVLPDLPDLDVATSVSHLTDSIAPRMKNPPVQPARRAAEAMLARPTRGQPAPGDDLKEPEPLPTRSTGPGGGGVQVVRSHVVGQTGEGPRRLPTKGTPPMGIGVPLGPPRRPETAAVGSPRVPPPAAAGFSARDIDELIAQAEAEERNALEDQLETISAVRRSTASTGPTRGGTPAWGTGAPSNHAALSDAFTRDHTPRGSSFAAPTPAMGSVLPPATPTRAGATAASASGRHAAQADQTGRFVPQPPRAPKEVAAPVLPAHGGSLDDAADLETDRPGALAAQEKRLPQTFIAPPETSRANLLSNAAAFVSVISVVGILWLVMR
ncbi:MAG: protein kinase [Polyangiales bacterium]